jgi:hypothetical protein
MVVSDPDAPRGRARRAVLGTLAVAAAGAPLLLSRGAADAATKTAAPKAAGPVGPLAPRLMWSPNPATDGLRGFEGIEDDRAHSHVVNKKPVQHIYVRDGVYRFDMHAIDRDGSDRQRNEVKGMHTSGGNLEMDIGQTWRITYDLFMPESLKGCDHFCHIFQLKRPGPGSSPLVTMSLRRRGGREEMALRAISSGGDIASTPLAPLRNKWITVDMTFRIGDGTKGMGQLVVTDGGRTVVTGTRDRIDIWLGDRIRPKWGIYRSIKSPKSQIIDTFLLMRNMRAYLGT